MPRASAHARRRRAETAAARRKRRLAGLVLLASVALITLLLTAFGPSGGSVPVRTAAPAPATRLLPAAPPRPQVVALQGPIRLMLPVPQSRLTTIGYHASPGSLELRPIGRQVNQGLVGRVARNLFGSGTSGLRYYVLGGAGGSATASLDVGAAPGTDVYSPVDGTIVGITPYVLAGKHLGARIDIQPSGNPSIVVSLTHLRPDPSLTVGSTLSATTSKVGTILDFTTVERQALANVTQNAGNHVAIEVHPATLSLP